MAPRAPATEPVWQDAALVLCAHGIRGGPGVAAEHAATIARRALFAEVHACAHKGEPGLLDVLARVEAPVVYLAPLLMAEGFTLRTMLTRLETFGRRHSDLRLCRPVGRHPRLAALLATKAKTVAWDQGWRLRDTALLITGHGTTRHAQASATARRHAAEIAASGAFAEVVTAFLDQSPTILEATSRLRAPRLVAVGLLVDRGEHGEEDIPRLLAAAGGSAVYTGPIGGDPAIADLVLDLVRAAELCAGGPSQSPREALALDTTAFFGSGLEI
jgi:sirohydrochlorin cobaltochelatase